MARTVLLAWVLLSIPVSLALGHMFRSRRVASPPGGFSPHDIATMVSRQGYRAR